MKAETRKYIIVNIVSIAVLILICRWLGTDNLLLALTTGAGIGAIVYLLAVFHNRRQRKLIQTYRIRCGGRGNMGRFIRLSIALAEKEMTLIVQIFQENNGKKAVDKKRGYIFKL